MRKFTALSAAVVLVAVGGIASPAAAQEHRGAPHRPHHRTHQSSNWAGYVAGGTHKTVVTTWVNPEVDCSTRGIVSWWDGIDGQDSNTVEQIGVDANCESGSLRYEPWYELYPQDSVYFDEPTDAGDTMTATTAYDGDHRYTMTLADSTKGWSKTFHGTASGDRDVDAEVIVEAIGSGDIPPCPDFGTVSFSQTTVDDRAFAEYGPGKTDLVRDDTRLTATGDLNGGDFSVRWLHS